jgi:hypothetical protein
MCPHTAIYVSSYYYISVLILLSICPHTAICVLITIHVSSYYYILVLIPLYVSSYYYTCVLILLYMCPHPAIFVSSYYHIRVLILLHVPSYNYICVLRTCDSFDRRCLVSEGRRQRQSVSAINAINGDDGHNRILSGRRSGCGRERRERGERREACGAPLPRAFSSVMLAA